jgi:hypothetical protein
MRFTPSVARLDGDAPEQPGWVQRVVALDTERVRDARPN